MHEPLLEADYGEGAYGPTIMVIVPSAAGVTFLSGLLRDLAASDPGTRVELHEQPEASVQAAILHLTMQVVERGRRRRLERTPRGGFDWSCTPDEWETAALLVEALDGRPGHQYLTSEGEDDALIEVSYGERAS